MVIGVMLLVFFIGMVTGSLVTCLFSYWLTRVEEDVQNEKVYLDINHDHVVDGLREPRVYKFD